MTVSTGLRLHGTSGDNRSYQHCRRIDTCRDCWKISENAAAGSDRYVFHVVIGLAVMMILYLLDYTVLARFSKIIAVVLLSACLVTLLGGCRLNGARYFIVLPGGRGISMQTLMLFYVPIYGAILYKYHGWGYKGLMRAIIWMIAPVILVYAMPAFMRPA